MVLLLLITGCASTTAPAADRATSIPSASVAQTPSASRTHTAAKTSKPVPPSIKPVPVETTGGVTINTAGVVLPDPRRTPGAINPAVTQASIGQTICVSGWTATVRPSSGYTTGLKEQQLASGYAYHGDTTTGDYEEDHLISLELGGSPGSELNLWPEPYAATDGARVKDTLENKLHALVCSGSLSLAVAQRAVARNWWNAYLTYVGSAPPPTTYRPPPTSASAPAAGPPAGATALCNDGTYSYAAHHQGACSHHGGVAIFYQ
jgi:Protein of unknown function (DUF3761)